MFTAFRYGLLPVVLFCIVVVSASIDTISENATRKSDWPQVVARVIDAQAAGDMLAKFRGATNDFPDPYGTLRYVVGGKNFTWQGRARDIGLTVLKPGESITLHYNPANPQQIGTLVLLGAQTGV